MDERRQLPRWQVKRQAQVRLPQTQECNNCILEDINLKGMSVSFDKALPQEPCLKMSLDLKDDLASIKLEINLLWGREDEGRYVYGMSFSRIMESDKDRIYEYTNSHCTQQLRDKWWEGVALVTR